MQLHQLLRIVLNDTPIAIYDIQGIKICRVLDKKDINVDLYEYRVFAVTVGIIDNESRVGIRIMIEK